MQKTYYLDSKQYRQLCTTIYNLIDKEIENIGDNEATYPKLIIMYEFFRLLRGEAFTEFREPLGEEQKNLYKMEEGLFKRIKNLRIDNLKDYQKAHYYYEQMISKDLKIENENIPLNEDNATMEAIKKFILQDHKRLETENSIKLRKEWINEIKYLNSFLIFVEQKSEDSRDFFSATQFTSPGLQNILERDASEIDNKSDLHKILADFLFKKTDPRRLSAIFKSTGINGLYIAYGKTENEPFLFGYIKASTKE